jgi:hypothetical protein
MKLTKSLFMLCAAGLSLCACNSDDIKPSFEKEGAVEITIVPPTTFTRATDQAASGEDGATIKVTGDMYVTLKDGSGSKTKKIASDAVTKSVKFWGVNNPQSVVVTMNGGQESYETTLITASSTNAISYLDETGASKSDNVNFSLQAAPSSIPVYGKTTDFTLTDEVETNNGTNYQMYTARVELEIPVARLEVSVKRTSASTAFSKLDLKGVYLDNIKPTDGGSFLNYKHPNDNSTTVSGQNVAILYDTHETVIDFTAANAIAPASNVYSYNFYGWDGDPSTQAAYNNPQVKLYFSNVVAAAGGQPVPVNQYAIIKKFKNSSDEEITLQNGKIYYIKNINLIDTNVGPVESGDQLEYAVEVTVVEAQWTVALTTGEWAN